MNVYYVYPVEFDYDEYNGVVVVAKSEDEALKLSNEYFAESNSEICVEKVDLTKESVVMTSFHAG